VRRVTYVTAAALAATLVMAVLTAWALNERREAERQRAGAEGLVEFMLTDLRDRLKAVGRLDALQAVNQRALRYYGNNRDLDRLSDESLERRARIFQAIGEDDLRLANSAGALAAFHEASRTTAEQAARNPGDPERLFAHATTLGGIGRVYEVQENWPASAHYYSELEARAEQLPLLAPGNPNYLMRAASAAIDLGNVHLRHTHDYEAAQQAYERALALMAQAVRLRPGDAHILLGQANAYGYLADTFYYRERWMESLAARASQRDLVARLRDRSPGDADVCFRLAAADRGLAYSLLQTDRPAVARSHLKAAYVVMSRLAAIDPANREWDSLRTKILNDYSRFGIAPSARSGSAEPVRRGKAGRRIGAEQAAHSSAAEQPAICPEN
jgi:hypothetical protein